MPIFNYRWNLSDGYHIDGVNKHHSSVFSTFACGGGSTMGYKLAGFNVIGANDIDTEMAKVYKKNHNPKFYFNCPISDLLTQDLPLELFNLDILDGSPPCSTFSMAGSREKAFGIKKKFREGQSSQVLSDLFFDWIKLVKRLSSKIAIAENVKGMIMGNAQSYTKTIIAELESIGYKVQLFLLNSANMGVPQSRQRVFFVARKASLNLNDLNLEFNEKQIQFKEIDSGIIESAKAPGPMSVYLWHKCKPGCSFSTVHPNGSFFNSRKIHPYKPLPTITASPSLFHHRQCRYLDKSEVCLAGSYPLDYDFGDTSFNYLVGMSVPPIMVANLSYEIYKQWLKINKD